MKDYIKESIYLFGEDLSVTVLLISYFSASGNALLSVTKILLGGRTDRRTDVRPATCNI